MTYIPTITSYDMPVQNSISDNVAKWKIDPSRAVLLIHDMQEFFLRFLPEDTLRPKLIANVRKLKEYCNANGIPVGYTTQPGDMSKTERGLLKDFWGDGMKANAQDRSVVADLKPSDSDWIFTKWRYSAFHNSTLLENLQKSGRNQLIICGVYAHIGILATAIESFSNNIETFIVGDAVADFSKEKHLMALEYASKCCAVNVFTQEITE